MDSIFAGTGYDHLNKANEKRTAENRSNHWRSSSLLYDPESAG